jgi:phage shock protein A
MTQLQIAPPTVDDRLARLERLVTLLSVHVASLAERVTDMDNRLAVLKQTTDVALCDLQTLDYAVDEMADTTRALSRDVDVLATAALDAMKSIEKLEKA